MKQDKNATDSHTILTSFVKPLFIHLEKYIILRINRFHCHQLHISIYYRKCLGLYEILFKIEFKLKTNFQVEVNVQCLSFIIIIKNKITLVEKLFNV